jgi:transglutaminase-like putative cysteine protease
VGEPVRFRLEQEIDYTYTAPVRALHQRLVVVPRVAHGPQRRQSWNLVVDGAERARRRVVRDEFGNLTIEVLAERIESSVRFVLDTVVERAARPELPRATAPDAFTAATSLTRPDDALRALADDVRPDCDPADICALVHRSLAYEWGVTGVHTTAAEALAGGRGVCQDYAHVMLAVCRIVGLPARYVSGHLLGEGGSHAWVEVLRPMAGGRWAVAEAWDPTHDRPAGSNYLTVAVGRDYADVAPLSGTYDAAGAVGTLRVQKRLTAA